MIKNKEGKVYIRYYQPANKFVRVGKNEYVATVQHGVSMILAEETDAQALLEYRGRGCCGEPPRIFSLPNQESVNVWETGDR